MSTLEPGRPSPEHFLNLIRRQERGRLKVYLGSAAGVGKTYSMLREGQRLKNKASMSPSASSRPMAASKRRSNWATSKSFHPW